MTIPDLLLCGLWFAIWLCIGLLILGIVDANTERKRPPDS